MKSEAFMLLPFTNSEIHLKCNLSRCGGLLFLVVCCFYANFVFLLQLHMAEHPAGHLVLKWLIEQDMMLAEAGKEGNQTHTHRLHPHYSVLH